MKRISTLAIAFGSVAMIGLSSCGKLKEISSKLSGADQPKEEKKEDSKNLPGMAITQEQLDQSDAGYADYLIIWEKLPSLLVKVQDEKSAFEIRTKIDQLALELPAVSERMIEIADKSDLKRVVVANKNAGPKSNGRKRVKEMDATVYWYVKAENGDAYDKRSLDAANSIMGHLERITHKTRATPVVADVIHSGILEMIMAEEGILKKSNTKSTIKPMPKNWLPPGVTRE